MKRVKIDFDGIDFHCTVKLNQVDNIDQGFEIKNVMLNYGYDNANFKNVLDQDKLIKLIYEQLKKL